MNNAGNLVQLLGRDTKPGLNCSLSQIESRPSVINTNFQALLQATLEMSPYPQCIISRNYELLATNKKYQQRYGISGPLAGQTCHQVSHHSNVPCSENGEACPLLRCAASQSPTSVTHIHQESGGRRKVQIDMEPLFDDRGRAFAFIETIRPMIDHDYRGIILFDIKGFMSQGLSGSKVDPLVIDQRQESMLGLLHDALIAERQSRQADGCEIPLVEQFISTGDGYYVICPPKLDAILDIAHCLQGLLADLSIEAYLVVHIGRVHSFVDMTGRMNVTGYALGEAARLHSVSKATGLICSEALVEQWEDNRFYAITDSTLYRGEAKDGVTYYWRVLDYLPS